MNILRGTFRLSLVAAMITFSGAAIYDYFDKSNAAQKQYAEDYRMWTTLRCGRAFIGKDMREYTNQYGNIDIGKAGCANKQFFATFEEIKNAMAEESPSQREIFQRYYDFKLSALSTGVLTAFVFVLINLLGLVVLATRYATDWIRQGFQ